MGFSRLKLSLFVILFLICIAILDYPYIARIYNDRISGTVIADYRNLARCAPDLEKRLEKARQYNRSLLSLSMSEADPFSGDSTVFSDPESVCRQLLCLDNSTTAGIIEIPAISLEIPVLPDCSLKNLAKGACILPGSSLPVGGEGTHACISGHSGLPDKSIFTNLDLLRQGDRIYLHVLGRTLCYEVSGNEVCLPHETGALAVRPGEDLLTLITCTPYGINTHRLFVHAKRTDPDGGEDVSGDRTDREDIRTWLRRNWYLPATAYLFIFMLVLVMTLYQFGRRND